MFECLRGCSLAEGEALHLSAVAEGRGVVTLQWQRDGTPVPGATGGRLEIGGMGLGDGGRFTCTASNHRGAATSLPADVTVQPRQARFAAGHRTTYKHKQRKV